MDREKVVERLTGLKELLKFQKDILGYGCFIEDINDALALLEEQEAEIDEISDEYLDLGKEMAKRPEIVRCKDCKHWDSRKNECHNINSYMQYRPCFKDWYCADGERRGRSVK